MCTRDYMSAYETGSTLAVVGPVKTSWGEVLIGSAPLIPRILAALVSDIDHSNGKDLMRISERFSGCNY